MVYIAVTRCDGIKREGPLLVPVGEGGINPPTGATLMQTLNNFRALPDMASLSINTPTVGIISKSPAIKTWKATMPSAGRTRGIYQHYKDLSTPFLLHSVCTADYSVGKVFALNINTNTWFTLISSDFPYHSDFTSYGSYVYFTFGNSVYKWNCDTTNWANIAPQLRDKGGTTTNLTGTLTFTASSAAVTGSSTQFTSELARGDWIKGTSGAWYEVLLVTDNTHLTLSLNVVASYAGTAVKAPLIPSSWNPKFILNWHDRNWLVSNNFDRTVRYSATADMETFTGSGAGYVEVGDYSFNEGLAGVGILDDYIFFFGDFSYWIYHYTGDTLPIRLVRRVEYGTISHRTIKKVNDGLAYASNTNEMRWTNGQQDIRLSDAIKDILITQLPNRRAQNCFSLSATDNTYPFVMKDNYRKEYALVIPSGVTNSKSMAINLGYKTGKFDGIDQYYNAGHAIEVQGTGSQPEMVFAPMTSSNQLYQFDTNDTDISTVGEMESPIFFSGLPNKKIRINWVELGLHPIKATGIIDTIIKFNYRKDNNAVNSAKERTYAMNLTPTLSYELITKRFEVDDTMNFFSWYLTESFGGSAAEDFGIAYWAMDCDLINSP